MDQGSHRTVLVVDDHASIRMVCRANLEDAGMRVIEASNGVDAVELARAERPHVILLDIMMPRVSGWDVAAKLLEDGSTDEIPIIFISARTDVRDRLRALQLGALEYITKPFDPTELAPTINALLDQVERGERDGLLAEKFETLQAELPAP